MMEIIYALFFIFLVLTYFSINPNLENLNEDKLILWYDWWGERKFIIIKKIL